MSSIISSLRFYTEKYKKNFCLGSNWFVYKQVDKLLFCGNKLNTLTSETQNKLFQLHTFIPSLTPEEIVQSLHIIAKYSQLTNLHKNNSIFNQKLWTQLGDAITQDSSHNYHKYQPTHLCILANVFAKVNHHHKPLFNIIIQQTLKPTPLSLLTPRCLPNLLNALASLQIADSAEAIGAVGAEIRELLSDLSPQGLAMVVHGLSKLGCYEEMIWEKLMLECIEKREKFEPQSLVISIYGSAKATLKCTSLYMNSTLSLVDKHVKALTSQCFANLFLAYSKKAKELEPEILTSTCVNLLKNLPPTIEIRHVVDVCYGLSRISSLRKIMAGEKRRLAGTFFDELSRDVVVHLEREPSKLSLIDLFRFVSAHCWMGVAIEGESAVAEQINSKVAENPKFRAKFIVLLACLPSTGSYNDIALKKVLEKNDPKTFNFLNIFNEIVNSPWLVSDAALRLLTDQWVQEIEKNMGILTFRSFKAFLAFRGKNEAPLSPEVLRAIGDVAFKVPVRWRPFLPKKARSALLRVSGKSGKIGGFPTSLLLRFWKGHETLIQAELAKIPRNPQNSKILQKLRIIAHAYAILKHRPLT